MEWAHRSQRKVMGLEVLGLVIPIQEDRSEDSDPVGLAAQPKKPKTMMIGEQDKRIATRDQEDWVILRIMHMEVEERKAGMTRIWRNLMEWPGTKRREKKKQCREIKQLKIEERSLEGLQPPRKLQLLALLIESRKLMRILTQMTTTMCKATKRLNQKEKKCLRKQHLTSWILTNLSKKRFQLLSHKAHSFLIWLCLSQSSLKSLKLSQFNKVFHLCSNHSQLLLVFLRPRLRSSSQWVRVSSLNFQPSSLSQALSQLRPANRADSLFFQEWRWLDSRAKRLPIQHLLRSLALCFRL